jgi:regulator of chromosome condensation
MALPKPKNSAAEASPTKKHKKTLAENEICRSDIGQVFVVGSGDCGQLGLGPDIFEKEKPAKLSYFDDLKIVDVVAGGLHTIALSATGKVAF